MDRTLVFQFGAAQQRGQLPMLDASSSPVAPDVPWAELPKLAVVLILQQLEILHHSHSDYVSAACCTRVQQLVGCSCWRNARNVHAAL